MRTDTCVGSVQSLLVTLVVERSLAFVIGTGKMVPACKVAWNAVIRRERDDERLCSVFPRVSANWRCFFRLVVLTDQMQDFPLPHGEPNCMDSRRGRSRA